MLKIEFIVVLGIVTLSASSLIDAQKKDNPEAAHIKYEIRNIIAREGSFFQTTNGIIYDKNSKLEWYPGPDEDTSWHEARQWTNNLKIDGGRWRMPTLAELKTLYKENYGNRNMPKLFNMTGWWVWSGEKVGDIAGCFYFIDGENHSDFVFYSGKFRGFAVRQQK